MTAQAATGIVAGLSFLPHGWSSVPVGVALVLFAVGYVRLGPPAILLARAGFEEDPDDPCSPPTPRLPEASFSYSPRSLQVFMKAVTRQSYRWQLKWDLVFASALGAGLVVLLDGTLGWALRDDRFPYLFFIPVGAMVADWAEDLLLLSATKDSGVADATPSERLVKVARFATALKWSLYTLAVGLSVFGAVLLTFRGPGTWSGDHGVVLFLLSMILAGLHFLHTRVVRREWLSVFLRVAVAVAVLGGAAHALFSFLDLNVRDAVAAMGFDTSADGLRRALLWGGIPAASILAVAVLAAMIPIAHSRFADAGFKGGPPWRIGIAIVAILVGTVFLEETLFRGLLLVAWQSHRWFAVAVAGSSITFGLWHIGPAVVAAERRDSADAELAKEHPERAVPRPCPGQRTRSTIIRTVVGTTGAGIVLCLFRSWSQGIWAPMLIHGAVNSGGVLFSRIGGGPKLQTRRLS